MEYETFVVYDFNGNQYVGYDLDYQHKINLYPYMLKWFEKY